MAAASPRSSRAVGLKFAMTRRASETVVRTCPSIRSSSLLP
jgi:hypothetical protein